MINHSECVLLLLNSTKGSQGTFLNCLEYFVNEDKTRDTLHAQRRTLCIIIVVVVDAFVGEQRRDTYYRNDPSKYGLGSPTAQTLFYIRFSVQRMWDAAAIYSKLFMVGILIISFEVYEESLKSIASQ